MSSTNTAAFKPMGNSLRSNVSSKPVSTSNSSVKKGFFSKVKDVLISKQGLILLIIGIVLLFIIVILYILFMMKSNKLTGKQLTYKPIKLNDLTTPLEIGSTELPQSVVGREYSYSFWLYIENNDQSFQRNANSNKIIPMDKLIFYRGVSGDISTANPIVTMDGLSNKMFIAIKTQNSTLTSISNIVNYNDNLYNIRYMNYFLNSDLKIRDTSNPDQGAINKYLILTVDYVPLQRWVNVTFIVDNKIITVYVDGEIYSVKNTEEFKAVREPELDIRGRPVDVNIIVDKTDNNVYVGKNSAVGNNNTVNGYLGKLQFYNYALSMNDIKKIYASGPIGFTSWLGGKSTYGIRSPVFRLDEPI
jgi:hypothetical protein